MKHDDRKRSILASALAVAAEHGYSRMSRRAVGEHAGCAEALVSAYFSTMKQLQRAVVGEAIRTENLAVICQALVERHPRVADLSDDLKQRALGTL